MEKRVYQILTLIFLVVCVFLKCTSDRKDIVFNDFHNEKMEFKQIIDSLVGVIATQQLVVEETSQNLQLVLREKAMLKEDIEYQNRLNFELKIENEKLKKVKEEDGCSTFELESKCMSLSLDYFKRTEELHLKSFSVATDLTLSIGKKGAVSAVFSNSCINVNSMNTLKVQKKQRWWENGWIRFGAGVLVGGSLIFIK